MNQTLAIIHTTPVTVEPLKNLAANLLPECGVVNLVDDSILPELAKIGGDTAAVQDRLIQYSKIAEDLGANAILNACSSVGGVVKKMEQAVKVPVVRIDEEMAEQAVHQAKSIGVAATLETTLEPTQNLLIEKSSELGKKIDLCPCLVTSAYEKLMEGDKEGHDRILGKALAELIQKVDIVVLAQASMAKVVEQLPSDLQGNFLSSPKMGMERVKRVMAGLQSGV
ncbi:hypothetical protein EV207_11082 [Scopulibacillus darangshiensis]|uniref:Asp/Glu/hydantoin racemase n=1 Tax=Scopulibacillus darangshiensis TaxID=442528 RepID=A0A4R2P656_9BACL|nr:aspartate/glutamate racemase family protein [Scopulibacillus darangshiensis]TCP29461.1 hypothetical protein EV207_11082 [Scopulibacillus darangshiensis]